MKFIGKILWIVLGAFLLIVTTSWGKYVFARESLGSVIIFVPWLAVSAIFLVYIIMTVIYFIRRRKKLK